MKSSGVLANTKCTVIGPMQFFDGSNIRDYFKAALKKRKITVFDHYNNPFFNASIKEDKTTQEKISLLVKEKRYKDVEKFKSIRLFDLALIDKSDFIIIDFVPNVTMCGTWEEFFWANRMKKPIFFIAEGGESSIPAWVIWTIGYKYIYKCKEDVLDILCKIDDGIKKIDSDRWKLLKPEFR